MRNLYVIQVASERAAEVHDDLLTWFEIEPRGLVISMKKDGGRLHKWCMTMYEIECAGDTFAKVLESHVDRLAERVRT